MQRRTVCVSPGDTRGERDDAQILKPFRGRCILRLVNLAIDRAAALQRRESPEADTSALTQGNASSRNRRRVALRRDQNTSRDTFCPARKTAARPEVGPASFQCRLFPVHAVRCTAGTCTSRGALMLKPTESADGLVHCATDMPRVTTVKEYIEDFVHNKKGPVNTT